MDRRAFIKGTAIGAGTLVGAPAILVLGATPARAAGADTTGFFFAAVSSAGRPSDSFIMQGCGHFEQGEAGISGDGFWTHFDGTTPGTPKLIKATGLWKPQRLISFVSIGSFGAQLAGIMVADVRLERQFPTPEAVIPARLTVVCNIGPAGLFTNPLEDEGFQLMVGSLHFMPLTPTNGISGFSRSLEASRDD